MSATMEKEGGNRWHLSTIKVPRSMKDTAYDMNNAHDNRC